MKAAKRISDILLRSDTEYTEFILGIISFLTGIWLFLPFCHPYFIGTMGQAAKPEVWGTMLVFSGVTKFIGVLRGRLGLRQVSCFLALLVWWFLGVVFVTGPCLTNPLGLLMFVFGMFNAFIYIKLTLVARP